MSECSLDRVTISFCIYTHSSLPFLNTYTRNSIFARALPLALICSSLSICLRLSWEILILCQLHGNEYFFFLTYFRRVRITFRCWLLFCFSFPFIFIWAADAALVFFFVISFHSCSSFWGSSHLDGCASSCRIPGMFFFVCFFGRIRRKGEGAQNLALIP